MSFPTNATGVASLYPHNMNDCSVSGSKHNQQQKSGSGEESSSLSTEEESKWLERFNDIKRHRVEHKNCNVPRSYGKVLKVWVDTQRRDYRSLIEGRASSLNFERIQKLESIGFEWCDDDDDSFRVIWDNEDNFRRWIERFQELQSYKAKYGHCNLPTTLPALGLWASLQRQQYWLAKTGKISCMNGWFVHKLESIGFEWSNSSVPLQTGFEPFRLQQWAYHWSYNVSRRKTWETKYQELQSYKAKYGDCNVPMKHEVLGKWVNTQRTQYRFLKEGKTSSMTDERVQKLVSIGFQWAGNANHSLWNKRFEELQSYKTKHGDCNVPIKRGVLGRWVNTQRAQYRLLKAGKSSSMTDERVQKLESIGFQRVSRAARSGPKRHYLCWDDRFEELQSYQAEHGNCNVPRTLGTLGNWVNMQRTQYQLLIKGKTAYMTDERVQKLESIGFQWVLELVRPRNVSTAQQPPSATSDDTLFCESDDADCIISEATPTDNKMDDHDGACGVLSNEPTIVVSSQVASSNVVPVFRPFLLGTGYC